MTATHRFVAILAANIAGYSPARRLRRGGNIRSPAGIAAGADRPADRTASGPPHRQTHRLRHGITIEFARVVDAARSAIGCRPAWRCATPERASRWPRQNVALPCRSATSLTESFGGI